MNVIKEFIKRGSSMSNVSNIGTDKYNDEKTIRQTALEKIKEAMEPESTMSEEEKVEYENKLNKKIKMGDKLSQSEMDYIRRTNPYMYIHIKRVQMRREMLEKKFENCKSKKEVQEAYNLAMSGIDKKDPDRQALLTAFDNVTDEFKKTSQYKALPQEVKKEEEKEKEREKKIEDMIDTVNWDDNDMKSFDVIV